jgi:hypothetical protein
MLKTLWEGIRAKSEKILISSVFLSSLVLAFLGGSLYKQDHGQAKHLVITVPDYQKAAEELKKADSSTPIGESQGEIPKVEPVAATVVTNQPDTALTSIDSKTCPYLGSKNSDKYHLATCGVVKRIKPTNIRCFATPEIAEAAGYKPGCLK